MESSVDADLNFGDIIESASALKQAVFIAFSPARKSRVDQIRFHIECIKDQLDRLGKIAGDDRTIGDGVEGYAIETVENLVRLIEQSLEGCLIGSNKQTRLSPSRFSARRSATTARQAQACPQIAQEGGRRGLTVCRSDCCPRAESAPPGSAR